MPNADRLWAEANLPDTYTQFVDVSGSIIDQYRKLHFEAGEDTRLDANIVFGYADDIEIALDEGDIERAVIYLRACVSTLAGIAAILANLHTAYAECWCFLHPSPQEVYSKNLFAMTERARLWKGEQP